jgi:triacylglycerol lipase
VPTGHSLGGALAVVTALELSLIYPKKIQTIYNYGCPRLGNLQLANYLKTRVPTIYRVVHFKDLVPHFPSVDFKYMHPANEVLYD